MRRLSERSTKINPSPTVALNAKAKELKAQGKNIINLSVGEPDYNTPQNVKDAAIDAIVNNQTRYGTPGGGPELKKAIQEKLKRENGADYSLDQIVCGHGAKEILFLLSQVLFEPGDEVLVPIPYWVSYPTHVEYTGAKAVFTENTSIKPLAKDFSQKLSPKTKAVIINSPNNPAGYSYSQSELSDIRNVLKDHDCLIISDEIYEYMTKDFHSIIDESIQDRCIRINGFSKAFAMTGWRVGYMAGPLDIASKVKSLISQSSTSIASFVEAAACEAATCGASLMKNDLDSLDQRRELTFSLLNEFVEISPIEGAFYAFFKVPTNDTLSFCLKLLEEKNVAMVAGEAFGMPGHIRMSFATSKENIIKGVNAVKELLG